MKVLKVQNVNEALPRGLNLLKHHGILKHSRGGDVIKTPFPVTTHYTNPLENVLFWEARDANPFFHLYEAFWMLAGRNDITPLVYYAKQMEEYADNGKLWGAYGYRWRIQWFDQLPAIASALKKNPEDRRQVLQMWSTNLDLGGTHRDHPCNVIATLQVEDGKLNLVVFCRSNDIIWGAYGANAVHMSVMLEYVALLAGYEVGSYYQVSVNYHAYVELFDKLLLELPDLIILRSHYAYRDVHHFPMSFFGARMIPEVVEIYAQSTPSYFVSHSDPWMEMVSRFFHAHAVYKSRKAPEKYVEALHVLDSQDPQIDWIQAGIQWIQRRYDKWQITQ